MAMNLIKPGRGHTGSTQNGNFPIPKALLCSGLLSATAWGAIAGVVMLLH